ncbi:MAG: peptidoglycan editing factor PgeF [Ferrimonas sp.]
MWITPDWPAPAHVLAFSTGRYGGVSKTPYRGLNLGLHVGDEAALVQANRAEVLHRLPPQSRIHWLNQIHGTAVHPAMAGATDATVDADASWSCEPLQFCAVMTADCLPLLLCDRNGTQVAAVHAGWRGLAAGVIENTVATFRAPAQTLLVWLGPAIGPSCFEVGAEVRQAFMAQNPAAAAAFVRRGERYLADIYALARLRLQQCGVPVTAIYGGRYCTVSDPARFFSYRRQSQTGRQASVIGLLPVMR